MEERIIINNIREITNALEERITLLMNRFIDLEKEVTIMTEGIEDIGMIKDPKIMEKINAMVDIFIELKPIERLIRFKYKEFNLIFDKLVVIEAERKYGKFFSFLMCLPGQKRKYTKKTNQFIERSLPGQTSIE